MAFVTNKARYGIEVMVYFGERFSKKLIHLHELQDSTGLSIKYLEQIVMPLSRSGYVQTLRGKYGGYRLTLPPEEYTVGDIIRVIDEPIVPVDCLATQYNTCEKIDSCYMLDYWEGLSELINDYLDNITLADVIRWKKEKK